MDPARPLLDVQEHDTAIDRLTARKDALEAGGDAAVALAEANEAERALGELRLRLDELARDQSRFEHEVDSMSQKTAAEERRLFDGSVANARELESIRHEVENLKKRRSDREDELLALMEVREEIEGNEREAVARSDALRSRIAEVEGAAADELARVTAELEDHREARRALADSSTRSCWSSTTTSADRRRGSARSRWWTASARGATSSSPPSNGTG